MNDIRDVGYSLAGFIILVSSLGNLLWTFRFNKNMTPCKSLSKPGSF